VPKASQATGSEASRQPSDQSSLIDSIFFLACFRLGAPKSQFEINFESRTNLSIMESHLLHQGLFGTRYKPKQQQQRSLWLEQQANTLLDTTHSTAQAHFLLRKIRNSLEHVTHNGSIAHPDAFIVVLHDATADFATKQQQGSRVWYQKRFRE
jgi:hypothetical protein